MKFTIHVPATTANLGPGFDCLGLALKLYNEVTVEVGGSGWTMEGEGAAELPEGSENLFWRAYHQVLRENGATVPSLRVRQVNRIPLGRGLGSSASAIVAGIVAAQEVLGGTLSPAAMVNIATRLEGHPDNVAPALLGGLILCSSGPDGVRTTSLPVPFELQVAVASPDVRVSTEEARRILPGSYPLADVTFTVSRACMLVSALLQKDLDALAEAVEDRIHTPWRQTLIPGYEAVRQAARQAGALGCFISGSGPTMAAFCREETGPAVAQAMEA
ncbi:MAG TPA: homoserine kinase, partial [Candidatus Xenobia bacterium]